MYDLITETVLLRKMPAINAKTKANKIFTHIYIYIPVYVCTLIVCRKIHAAAATAATTTMVKKENKY